MEAGLGIDFIGQLKPAGRVNTEDESEAPKGVEKVGTISCSSHLSKQQITQFNESFTTIDAEQKLNSFGVKNPF